MREPGWCDRYRKKLSKRLYAAASLLDTEEPLPIIVLLKEGAPGNGREIRRTIQALGGHIARDLPILGGFAAVLPGSALAKIASAGEIKQIHLDREAHPCLDIGGPSVLADVAQAGGLTGRGQTIAFLDSGIHPHADFLRPSSRLVAWYDAVNGRPRPYDDNGHGTHVAGIAAGNGYASEGRYRGVAPGARIAAVKVADANGFTSMSRVIAGMQWVLAHRRRYGIGVVNLSLGADPSEPYWNDPLCMAAEQLWRAGIVVVAAAGNDGPAPGSIDTPGCDPLVITVGAVDDRGSVERGDDVVPEFSSRGPTIDGIRKPDLLAPGVAIMAPQAGGDYIARTGTSMATAFVSGAAALLLAKEPGLSPEQVKHRLRDSTDRRVPAGKLEGIPYLNLSRLSGLRERPETGRAIGLRVPGPGMVEPAAERAAVKDRFFALAEQMKMAQAFLIFAGLMS